MTLAWAIAATAVAAVLYGGLRVSRRRRAAAEKDAAALRYALDFATEKQTELLRRERDHQRELEMWRRKEADRLAREMDARRAN